MIASPGTTNACLVSSMQSDPFFEIYSAPEERSGAYMACGMAAEGGEPVVLSCTGATASRNYMPALTEAFYRKLPILTVTSSRRNAYIGHNCDQVTDRTVLPNDVAKISVQMPIVLDDVSEWNCIINANKAVLELYHRGGGPAHINLETTYSKKKVADIQPVRIIRRFMKYDEFPNITAQRVCIFVGAHVEMDDKLERAISEFCKKYNGIVLCDHTSNYRGEYALGNRHVPSNIRILVVNNGLGFEMKFPASWGYSIANSIGVSEDNYVCAAGHYSSPDLIKSYVYGLGFEYLKVSTKEQYLDCLPKIVSNEKQDRTLVVEIVVNSENEDAALNLIGSIMVDESNVAKAAIKKAIGKKGIDAIKKMMGR